MDSINIKILKCLSRNARINASEIAEKVKLSVSAVIERIKKMENDGTIVGYSAEIDPLMLGKDVTAMILVTIDHPSHNTSFVRAIEQDSNIVECYYIAGDFDYMLKVITENTRTLEITLDAIKTIEGVSKTKTNLVLSSQKKDYSVLLKSKKTEILKKI
ncbi:MAG: Lrp/AsnC family transcriptional regulator [Clostridia bacterium]